MSMTIIYVSISFYIVSRQWVHGLKVQRPIILAGILGGSRQENTTGHVKQWSTEEQASD